MTAIPTPTDGQYDLDESSIWPSMVVLVVRDGSVSIEYPGGFDYIVSADKAEKAGKALLYWSAWKREQDILAWLDAENEFRAALRRLGLHTPTTQGEQR